MILSTCGIVCDECPFFNNGCTGCMAVEGKTFWAKEHLPTGICPLYDCTVNKKKLNSCATCKDLPCQIFRDLKDPSISMEEHEKSIQKRVAVLKGN
jgi:hypothetical protein